MNTVMAASNYWFEIDTPEDFYDAVKLFADKDIIPIA